MWAERLGDESLWDNKFSHESGALQKNWKDDYLTCLNCGKELTEKQLKRKFLFCSKGCATSFRQASHDPDCSKTLSGENLWYICGLITSDGNISENKITISLCDEELIKRIYPIFSDISKRKIYTYRPPNPNHSTSYSIINTNSHFLEFLNHIGIFERKSKNIKKIEIPKEFESHFIRGVFDGDGSVYISSIHKNTKYLGVSITSASNIFLEQIREILKSNNIDSNIIKDCRKSCYYLKIYKKDHIKLFFNYIYKDSTIYLQRKYKFFCNEIV